MTAIVIAFPDGARRRPALARLTNLWPANPDRPYPAPLAPDIDLARQRGRLDGSWCRHLTDGRAGAVNGILRIGDGIFARLWRDSVHYDTVPAHLLAPSARGAPL